MNPNRVDSLVDLAYGLLIFVAVILMAAVASNIGIAFGLGVLVSYTLHVVWKMSRFDPQWMSREVAESVEATVDETVAETVEETVEETVDETVAETVEETVDETVAETVEETVDETVAETVEETVDETVSETVSEEVAEVKEELSAADGEEDRPVGS